MSEQKKEQIRKVIEKTGYQPSHSGKNPKNRTYTSGWCGGSEDQFRINQPDHSGN